MSTRAPQSQLWDVLRGALVTRALSIVADLGIPGALAEGPGRSDELARDGGADPDTLHRLLRALASDGVFIEEEPGVFANTPASEQLLDRGMGSFRTPLRGPFYQAIGGLERVGQSGLSADLRHRFLVVARRQPARAERVRHRDGARKAAASGTLRPNRVARRRDGRRRRWRKRVATRGVAGPGARPSRNRVRPAGDRAGRRGARREDRVRRRQLLRERPGRRRLHPVDDLARLGRRASGGDPAHDPRGSATRCPPASPRGCCPNRQRS